MLIVTAVLAGSLVGSVLTQQLGALGYRRPDETGRWTPASRWWLIPATGTAWGWLVFTLAEQTATVIVMWLPLSAAFGWISAVDLDVQRIPNRTLGPTAIWVAICVIALAITEHDPDPLLQAVIASAGCLIGFATLHIASPNALGFGDVKLSAILGAAIGVVSLTAVLAALLFACILALTWATATRTTQLAFGPWIAAGAILGVGLPGLSGAVA